MSSGTLEDEVDEYRKVLLNEVANHKLFSRVTAATALGLIFLGSILATFLPSLSPLSYLLILVGALRFLNTFYDMQRQDKLQAEIRRLERQFQNK